jgi:UPF0716 family protein affecting phage T7 exclusion
LSLAPFFIYVLPILTVLAVAAVGSTRRLGFWLTLIASVFLTPIGGYILAVLSGAKRRKPKKRKRRAEAVGNVS